MLFARLYGVPDPAARAEKYLKLLGLWERREDEAGAFSKGMRQKLALARALLHEPRVLFKLDVSHDRGRRRNWHKERL